MEPVRKRMLGKALDFYREFLKEKRDDPSVRREAGLAYRRLGGIRVELGEDYGAAEVDYRKAIDLLRELAAESPAEVTSRSELARSYFDLGVLLKDTYRFRESEAAFCDALRLWEQLVKAFPTREDLEGELNKTRYQLGALLAKLEGRRPENEALYHAALEYLKRLIRANPSAEQRGNYARQLNNLGSLLADTGQRRDAEEKYRQAEESLEKLIAQAPSVPSYRYWLAWTYNNHAVLLREERPSEAEPLYHKASDLLKVLA